MAGPLAGLRVVELQGRGPGPFGVMLLADLGADVVRIDRPSDTPAPTGNESGAEKLIRGQRKLDLVTRGRRSVGLDLKRPEGLAAALGLIEHADVVVEGYRPGVAARLGVGPEACLERNPRLIYTHITGWGQDGPFAQVPGHDINYVALTGALDAFPRGVGQPPAPPLNLVGDYGGGGMLMVVGILAALLERAASGKGQVIDTAMVDGVALLTTVFHGFRAEGLWNEPGRNVLDLGAPFYNVYETADGRYVTIGSGEPQFYSALLDKIGLPELAALQSDQSTWEAGKQKLAEVFKTKTFDQWRELLEGENTCFAPVLTFDEATTHPHNVARQTYIEVDGVVQPAPAPRFSRTPAEAPSLKTRAVDVKELIQEWNT